MIDREHFYKALSGSPFFGLTHGHQKAGCEAILAAWEARGTPLADLRWLAYILATAWHETAHTMQPIAEIGHGRGHAYGVPDPHTGHAYYGRGYVQLTWMKNYATMSAVTGVDLVHHPDRAMEAPVASKILLHGMEHGSFTGRKLSDYFNEHETDWLNARRIVNGLDAAPLIESYAKTFYSALNASHTSDVPAPMNH